MNKIYIPIGTNCIMANSLKTCKLRHIAYPFDWMWSHPIFVYNVLYALFYSKATSEEIIKNIFFEYEQYCIEFKYAHYILTTNITKDTYLCNEKHNVVYPHNLYDKKTLYYLENLEKIKEELKE